MAERRSPRRGEIWQANLDPTIGHEQGGVRPVVVVSVDTFNRGTSRLVIVVPVTLRDRGNPLHVAIETSNGGVRQRSFALCDMVRSISNERLQFFIGSIDQDVVTRIDDRLKVLLDL